MKISRIKLAASTGAEAVPLFAANQEDAAVVLTDIMMPVMDGNATIRASRKLQPDLEFIATSGLPAHRDEVFGGDINAQQFLRKPFTVETLLDALHELLG